MVGIPIKLYSPSLSLSLSLKPDVRLAFGQGMPMTGKALERQPAGRLAVTVQSGAMSPENLAQALGPSVKLAANGQLKSDRDANFANPSVRLAHVPGAQGDNNLLGQREVKKLSKESLPALLISYVYLEPFLKNRHRYAYRDWVLDSGAFSAFNSGTKIDLVAYTEKCKELLVEDPTLTEIYALDVIFDWKTSLKNTEYMWSHGVPAIPCYHYGEPESALLHIAKNYPKIALGGIKLLKGNTKLEWAGQCFARVWPKRIHGFAASGKDVIMAFPWHSVDATSWEMGPCAFGNWKSFGTLSVRGSKQNLRAEVEYYLRLERDAQRHWKKEMLQLESLPDSLSPVKPSSKPDGKRERERE